MFGVEFESFLEMGGSRGQVSLLVQRAAEPVVGIGEIGIEFGSLLVADGSSGPVLLVVPHVTQTVVGGGDFWGRGRWPFCTRRRPRPGPPGYAADCPNRRKAVRA